MHINRKNLALALLLISMQSALSINFWQKLLLGSMSTAHWTAIAIPTIVGIARPYGGWAAAQQLPDAPLEFVQWAKSELKKMKFSDELINNLKIKIGKGGAASTGPIPPYIIIFTESEIEGFDKSEKKKSGLKWLLAHEAAHLENNDTVRDTGVALALPFIGHFGLKAIAYPFAKIAMPIWLQAGLKIPSAAAKLAIMASVYYIYYKYHEYAADKRAADGFYDAQAAKELSQVFLKLHEVYEKEYNLDPTKRNTLFRFIYDELHAPDPGHPSLLWRSQIIGKAAERLEKQDQNNQQ